MERVGGQCKAVQASEMSKNVLKNVEKFDM